MASATDMEAHHYLTDAVLTDGEEVVWTGRPTPIVGAKREASKFLMGIFFVGFSIFWITKAMPAGGIFPFFGLIFVGAGLWILSMPFRTFQRAKRTYYAITDRRVLIISAGRSYSTTSIAGTDINDFQRTDNPDGTGSIQLRKSITNSKRGTRTTVQFNDGLWGISDVKGAAAAITALRNQS